MLQRVWRKHPGSRRNSACVVDRGKVPAVRRTCELSTDRSVSRSGVVCVLKEARALGRADVGASWLPARSAFGILGERIQKRIEVLRAVGMPEGYNVALCELENVLRQVQKARDYFASIAPTPAKGR